MTVHICMTVCIGVGKLILVNYAIIGLKWAQFYTLHVLSTLNYIFISTKNLLKHCNIIH